MLKNRAITGSERIKVEAEENDTDENENLYVKIDSVLRTRISQSSSLSNVSHLPKEDELC